MQRDEEEAAKVYEDFVKDFGDGNEDTTKTGFVRGGVIEPGKRNDSGPPPSKRGRHYVPSYVPPGMATALDTNKGEEEEEVITFDDFILPVLYLILFFSRNEISFPLMKNILIFNIRYLQILSSLYSLKCHRAAKASYDPSTSCSKT